MVFVAFILVILLVISVADPRSAFEELLEDLIREGSKGGWERIARLEERQGEKLKEGWREAGGCILRLKMKLIGF